MKVKFNSNGDLEDDKGLSLGRSHIRLQIEGTAPLETGDGVVKAEIDPNEETREVAISEAYPTLFQVKKAGLNTALGIQQVLDVDNEIIMARLMDLPHRKVAPLKIVGPNAKHHKHYTRAHRAGAAVVAPGTTIPTDATLRTAVTTKILKLACGGNLPREWLTSYELAEEMADCRRQVDELEGQIWYEGCTLPAIDGAQAAANNTQAVISAWSNAVGTAKPLTDIQKLIAMMMADGFQGPYVLVTDPANWAEGQFRLENAGDGGITYALKNGIIAAAFPDPSCPHGNPILFQVDKKIACLGMSEDMIIVIGAMTTLEQTVPYTAHTRCVPVFKQDNGVGELTGA